MNRDELIAAMRADGAEVPVKVEIAKWGTVYVRMPSVAEVEATVAEREEQGEVTKAALAGAAARLICDENGNRIFDHLNDADIALLSKRRWSDLEKVIDAGREQGN